MIDGDLSPLRSCSSAQSEGFGQRNNPAKLLSGHTDNGVSLSHLESTYSTAIPVRSSGAIPEVAERRTECVMTLGDRMRAARLAARKTQEEVAAKLNVTKGAVSQWENDGTVPELEYFMAFCSFTGASADEILLGRDMDPLLRQLVHIWESLSTEGKDTLLGNANRILTDEKPEPGPHNPFGRSRERRKPSVSGNGSKTAKKGRL